MGVSVLQENFIYKNKILFVILDPEQLKESVYIQANLSNSLLSFLFIEKHLVT